MEWTYDESPHEALGDSTNQTHHTKKQFYQTINHDNNETNKIKMQGYN
jgi:hypothetical protein